METSTQLILALTITVVLTFLIVMGYDWIQKSKDTHPEIYKRRGLIGAILFLILNSGDFG
jgi:hypothetical protein